MRRHYDTQRWRKARARQLAEYPICLLCELLGKVTTATVVDHAIPWKTGKTEQEQYELFWDESNWQSLCASCHSRHKQSQEKGSGLPGCDRNGNPIDAEHHWNR